MDTNKAAYWIALGVLALGLNSEYRHGNFVAVHRVAERAGSVLCRISSRAEQSLAVALGMTDHENFRAGDLLAANANEGSEMARAEAEMAREQARASAEMVREQVRDEIRAQTDALRMQAEAERAQIEQIRWRTASQIRLARTANRVTVVCPRTGKRITLKAGAELAHIAPDVEIEENF